MSKLLNHDLCLTVMFVIREFESSAIHKAVDVRVALGQEEGLLREVLGLNVRGGLRHCWCLNVRGLVVVHDADEG